MMMEGDDSVMDTLLRYGSDLAVEDINGLTPGELAAIKNNAIALHKIKKCGMFLFLYFLSSLLFTVIGREWR